MRLALAIFSLSAEKNTVHVLSLVPSVTGITGWPTLKPINSPRFVQMIQSIKFTSLFWHSQEWPGSEDDWETKTDPRPSLLLRAHPLRRAPET